MSYLAHLFFSFSGRISRRSWWLGFFLLNGVSFGVGYALDPDDPFDVEAPFLLEYSILNLVLLFPAMVIIVKRLNDRDWPRRVAILALIVLASTCVFALFQVDIAPFLELSDAEFEALAPAIQLSVMGYIFYCIACLGFVGWLWFDNGFLQGSPGPNRYGPDPLNLHACTPARRTPRRSLDAYKWRYANIGIIFLTVAAYYNFRDGIVPNWLIAAFLLSFVFVGWKAIPLSEIKLRVLAFSASLAAFFILFDLGLIGGGASKLVTVTTLWLPWPIGILYSTAFLILAVLLSEAPAISFVGEQYSTVAALVGIVLMAGHICLLPHRRKLV